MTEQTTTPVQKVFPAIAYVVLALATALVTLAAYWVNQTTPALDIKKMEFKEIISGNNIRYVVLDASYCKNTSAEGSVRTSYISEDPAKPELFLVAATDKQERGCHDNVPVPIPIPEGVTPGKWKIHYRTDYQINPFKHSIQTFDSTDFTL